MEPATKQVVRSMVAVYLFSLALKIMLVPAYKSTDYDVHRNWLAITHKLPMREWYTYVGASEWTMDYPPLFGLFERLCARVGEMVLPEHISRVMLGLSEKDAIDSAASTPILYFQRATVMASDIFLSIGLLAFSSTWPRVTTTEHRWSMEKVLIVSALTLFNPGLIIVDHIHFQYNGMLLGMLLISVAFLRRGDALGDVLGGITFAILVCFKHIFAYCAPVYLVYLLRHFCFVGKSAKRRFSLARLATMGAAVAAVVAASIGPAVCCSVEGVSALLGRLAPVGRGLTHAYWAPNVWALYNLADKILLASVRKLGANVTGVGAGAMTGGLVGQSSHAILPSVPPAATAILTLLAMSPALVAVWKNASHRMFTHALVYCTMCSFMLGYHVHEKAVLMIIVPLTMAACDSARDARLFLLLSWTGQVSLLPLLFTPDVFILKGVIILIYGIIAYTALDFFILESRRAMRIRAEPNGGGVWLWMGDKLYLGGLAIVVFVLEGPALLPQYPFLPLLLTSTYCAIGMIHCWGLCFKQMKRKLAVVKSYQQSPSSSPMSAADVAGKVREANAAASEKTKKHRSSGSFDIDVPPFSLE